MIICPLYAKLPPSQQQRVFQRTPPNSRKFILCTNVAETSITIPGVSYVIDTGFAKVKRFHSMAGVEELRPEPISQSSANQRTGRAGREVKLFSPHPQYHFVPPAMLMRSYHSSHAVDILVPRKMLEALFSRDFQLVGQNY
jgi:hypothetical protein